MTWKEELLKGKATGAPLFLAWSIGVFAVYVVIVLSALLEDSDVYRWAFHTSLMFFSVCQGIFLLSQLWRRLFWALIYCVGVLAMFLADALETDWRTITAFTLLLQGSLFIGVRRRFWLWVSILYLQWILERPLSYTFDDLYRRFFFSVEAYLPVSLRLDTEVIYTLVLVAALGVVAAFFMPPIDSAKAAGEEDARVKAERRFVILTLVAILTAVLWLLFGQHMTMLRAARNARTREDVRNLRLKYPILLSHALAQAPTNTVTGSRESRFDLHYIRFYSKKRSFSWRFDTDGVNAKVVSYRRISTTVILECEYTQDEYRE